MGCYIARHTKRIQTGESVDMQGYGAKAFRIYNGRYQVVYGDYLVVQDKDFYTMYSNSNDSQACKSGTSSDGINYSYVYSGGFQLGFGGGWQLYGDVRYSDGSNAPTNDPIIVPAKFDCIICK